MIPNEVILGLFLDFVFIIAALIFYIVECWIPQYELSKRMKNGYIHVDKEPSFVVESWRKFKDKTCVKVEFK